MAEVKSYKCDECGVQKMESNHWIIAQFGGSGIGVRFIPWEPNQAMNGLAIHLCGEGCATKVLSRQITAWR